MSRTISYFIGFLIFATTVVSNAQKLTLNMDLYPNITKDYGKTLIAPYGGLGLNYHYHLKSQKHSIGLSFRSIAWGNEVSFDQEIEFPIFKGERNILVNVNTAHISYPLFYNKQSLGLGLSSRIQLSNHKLRRFRFYAGLRFSYNSSYEKISRSAALWEGRIGTSIVLKN